MESEPINNEPENDPADGSREYVAEAEVVTELSSSEENQGASGVQDPPMNAGVTYNPAVLVAPPIESPSVEESPMANLAANGGAVGSLVLGVLAFVGSFISSYAIVNSGVGIVMGLWGLSSNKRRLATLGLLLCTISALFCVVEISTWLQSIWPTEEV